MKNIAVVLSGCGAKDGTEITEAVSVLLALSELKVRYQIFAPQLEISSTNHITGEKENKRNTLVEAGRIARGRVQDLAFLRPNEYDGVVFPGGFGTALHLCTWATEGAHCKVLPIVQQIIEDFYDQSKPIGAICIAPALIARVLGDQGITITLGEEGEAAQEVIKTGAHHAKCPVDDYVTDREAKIITTPAYMYAEATPHQVYSGIRKAIGELVEMA